jgi:hypothetical protein
MAFMTTYAREDSKDVARRIESEILKRKLIGLRMM